MKEKNSKIIKSNLKSVNIYFTFIEFNNSIVAFFLFFLLCLQRHNSLIDKRSK